MNPHESCVFHIINRLKPNSAGAFGKPSGRPEDLPVMIVGPSKGRVPALARG
jgi:hypothetical protein